MKTWEFIEQLRGSRSKQILSVDENDTTIHGGYHLTELKAATFDTVDCGGQKNRGMKPSCSCGYRKTKKTMSS
jgi:hypothetical protein